MTRVTYLEEHVTESTGTRTLISPSVQTLSSATRRCWILSTRPRSCPRALMSCRSERARPRPRGRRGDHSHRAQARDRRQGSSPRGCRKCCSVDLTSEKNERYKQFVIRHLLFTPIKSFSNLLTRSPWGCRVSSLRCAAPRPRLCPGPLCIPPCSHSDLRPHSPADHQWSLRPQPRLRNSGWADWGLSRQLLDWVLCVNATLWPDLSSHSGPRRRRRMRCWRHRGEAGSGREAADWASAAESCSYAASSTWLSGFETKPWEKVLFNILRAIT